MPLVHPRGCQYLDYDGEPSLCSIHCPHMPTASYFRPWHCLARGTLHVPVVNTPSIQKPVHKSIGGKHPNPPSPQPGRTTLSVFHAPPRGSWWDCAPWTLVVPAQQGATYWLFFPSLTHFPIPLPAFPVITTQENHVRQNHCLRVCLWGSQPKEEKRTLLPSAYVPSLLHGGLFSFIISFILIASLINHSTHQGHIYTQTHRAATGHPGTVS